MKKVIFYLLIFVLIIFIIIQFIPVSFENPPVKQEIDAPDKVISILRDNCYDCHSNLTKWPWYNKIAPISWVIKRDVNSGRSNINFTEWDKYKSIENTIKEMIVEAVNEKRMPPLMYRLGHPSSKITKDELKILQDWAEGKFDK